MNRFKLVIVAFFMFFMLGVTQAQVTIDAEVRPRFEVRHGYKTLFPDKADLAAFISQRTRLNAGYLAEKMKFYISIQDVRVWGDVKQLNKADKNGLALHQAWGELLFSPDFSVKLGRQEIIYDDSRIFGNVGWAQQGRSHDAALLKYKKEKFKMDVGVAFNQSDESLYGTTLETLNTYKSLQYIWLHNDWSSFSGSFLLLNNGKQYIDKTKTNEDETRYSQTVGTHLKTKGTLSIAANMYYQFGKDVEDRTVQAYLLGLEGNYKISDKVKIGLGAEMQSGNSYDNDLDKNKAFTPFYGTNHKFNGFMDYFYVGNHTNSVGLLDIYGKANVKFNPKSALTVFIHNFSTAADINKTASKQLGTELDFVYGYKFSKDITIKTGYSQLFASKSMGILKKSAYKNTNNWGWLMVTIKPTLFTNASK